MLYLTDDGQGNRGPRIGDVAWQALWSRYFAEDEAPQTSAFKSGAAYAHSRRSSMAAGDSFADPSSSLGVHNADLSRSTLGESLSSRPSIPYVSSRPSPRVEALGFSRRDVSAEWSPSARTAAWSGNASSSAARPVAASGAFPRLPILARIEWQVDSNKAPWWPSYIASRSSSREWPAQPTHPIRKSMHLANNLSQSKEEEASQVSAKDGEDQRQSLSRDLESLKAPPEAEDIEVENAAQSSISAVPHAEDGASDLLAVAAAIPPTIPEDDKEELSPSSTPSRPIRSLHDDDAAGEMVIEEVPVTSGRTLKASSVELAPGRASPSDEPLRSQRASIVSMSSRGSHPTSSPSHNSAHPMPTAAENEPSASSTRARSPSPQSHLESSAALLSHHSTSDPSGTGYSEIIETVETDQDGDAEDTEHDMNFDREPLSLAHDGEYSALPDSPSSEVDESYDRQPLSAQEQSFPLRHSFIVEGDDEGMWRDLQHHGIDDFLPAPREDSKMLQHKDEQEEQSRQSYHDSNLNDFELVRSPRDDVEAEKPYQTQSLWTSSAPMQAPQQLYQQRYIHADDHEHDAYYSPHRSNTARIQSWIGKTPTGRPASTDGFSGGFEDHFGEFADEDGLQLPKESDIDEVVGLWASKIRADPTAVPHISGPSTSVTGDADDHANVVHVEDQASDVHDKEAGDRAEEANLNAAAPAMSLLSPIHLDAAAFGGVKPQLGNLTVPLSPQLLSPTLAGDASDTPRAGSPAQRSVSTPIIQQHPPTSPASLAPPLDRRPSSASRRSSGDLSDTLEDMHRALELLSPGHSPNPALGHSPVLCGRKMSSRDSLAYARSLSASVTPSPKWIARAKAATVKSRTTARSPFAAGGSPFDKTQVSPRPASTSAVSSSRHRTPRMGLPSLLSASRLAEFSKADTPPRMARTEVGDTDSIRSGDSVSDDRKEAGTAPSIEQPSANGDSHSEPSAHSETWAVISPKANAHAVGGDIQDTVVTKDLDTAPNVMTDAEIEPVAASLGSSASAPQSTKRDSQMSASFMDDDHDGRLASIQHFLRGKVISADSDASISHDMSGASASIPLHGSSADGTIIEHSTSIESDLPRSSPLGRADEAKPVRTAEEEKRAAAREETTSNERWSQVSYATGKISPHHPSGYSLNSYSPKQGMHQDIPTPSFTYDALLDSEPTTVDTQLSRESGDVDGLSVGEMVKSYMLSSPSDEAFFTSPGPSGKSLSHDLSKGPESGTEQHLQIEEHRDGKAVFGRGEDVAEPASSSPPALPYRFASSPIHLDTFPSHGQPLNGNTHDYSLGEEEIRTINADTRAAVREALSQSTSVNILPPLPASSSAPLSPKSSVSPVSSNSSLPDPVRRRGSNSLHSTVAGGGSGTSSPNKRRPARLNLEIDGPARSPPGSSTSAGRRLHSTSPRSGRFSGLPPSPSLHPSFKQAAPSSPLATSYSVMGGQHLGSPQKKNAFLPSLASVTSIEGGLAG